MPCDLCRSEVHSIVYDLGTYRILRCKQCGLVYRDPMPTDAELYELYNVPLEVSHESLVAYYKEFRQQTFRRIFEETKRISPLSQGALVLDVGAGNGWSYEVIREFGFHPIGTDLDFNDLLGARQYGATIQAWSEQLPIRSCGVDAVLSTDVLEHVRAPRTTLLEICRVLKPGGLYLFRVPDAYSVMIRAMDMAYMLSRGRIRNPGRRLYHYHLYGFSVKTLRRYLGDTGFKMIGYYRESSKNLAALNQKTWARNPAIRIGIAGLTVLGDAIKRQDELVVIAQKQSDTCQEIH